MKSQILSILFVISINLHKASIIIELPICDYSYINGTAIASSQQNINILGNASNYAVLAGSATTNAGATTVVGDMGVSPSTSIYGTAVTLIMGSFHVGDTNSLDAQGSLLKAYNYLAAIPNERDMTGTDLVGLTLSPGTYAFTSSAFLSAGILTLNGKANDLWVFQIATTLITSVNAKVLVTGGGSPFNVYWKVGSSATIAGGTTMIGNIVAYADITFGYNANLDGRALALNGQISLNTNIISRVPCK